MSESTLVLFATDIHGSERCFRKFLSTARAPGGPDVLVIGGDITGKYVVPVVQDSAGRWRAQFEGQRAVLKSEQEALDFENSLRDKGVYSWRCDPAAAERFGTDPELRDTVERAARLERLRGWVDLADGWLKDSGRRVFISGGNDDPWYIDEVLQESSSIVWPEGKVLPISESLVMLSTGVANRTPWNCPRDMSEEEIAKRIDAMARQVADFSKCVFNLHCPPFDTLLDRAPKLDKDLRVVASAFGVEEESVGSRAVRQAIEQYQPVASLHGHIHESRAFQRIGRTVCFNPGSEYAIGRLSCALLRFQGSILKDFELLRDLE